MDKKFIAFPSIDAFRHTIYNVNRKAEFQGLDDDGNPVLRTNSVKPTIKFTGTVKLHGTNAGICSNGTELWAQSRKNIITPLKDNAGFAFFVESHKVVFEEFLNNIRTSYGVPKDTTIAVYGEWCGKGIQKGVAISELEKMFVIFKIKLATDDENVNVWLDYTPSLIRLFKLIDINVSFIEDYGTYEIDIDFNNPMDIQNQLVDITNQVELECPVAKSFNVDGVGEGVVWTGEYEDMTLMFKVKGQKHSVSKVKKLASIDVEKLNNAKEFVEFAVTDNRLEQAVQEVFVAEGKDISKKEIKPFIDWVKNDVFKEELDTLAKNGLEPRDVIGLISKKSVGWLQQKYGL